MHYSSTDQQKGRWEGDVALLRAQRRHLRRRQDRGRQRCQARRTEGQEVEVEGHRGHSVGKQVPLPFKKFSNKDISVKRYWRKYKCQFKRCKFKSFKKYV